MPDIILDHIENIVLPADFPIKNLHALKYHTEGLHYLAMNIRDEEIRKYKLGAPAYEAIHMENHSLLMNMFNWFSISIINYIRLVGLVDYIVKHSLTQQHLETKEIKLAIGNYTKEYAKRLIPDIVQYRNKLSAHHSLIDPWKDDNLATLFTSSMNTIVYRNPHFEASLFMSRPDGNSDIQPWILTKIYEELCTRFWPNIHLKNVPTDIEITDLYKGLEAEGKKHDSEALEFYDKTILEYICSKDIKIQVQVAQAFIQKAIILRRGMNPQGAIIENQKAIDIFVNIDNLEIMETISSAIFNQAIVYSDINEYSQSLKMTELYFDKYNSSENLDILTSLGDLLINKGYWTSQVYGNKDALISYDNTMLFFQTYSEPELYIYELKAMVNKASLLMDMGEISQALSQCDKLIEKYNDSLFPAVIDQVKKCNNLIKYTQLNH